RRRMRNPVSTSIFLAAGAMVLGLLAATPAHAIDANACRELARKYEQIRADIASIQTNALLFSSAEKGCTPLARALVAAGASVQARDRLGDRPLTQAARAGHLELVKLFLEQGAPIDARNIAGSTALYVAAENDRLAVVRLLTERGADAN